MTAPPLDAFAATEINQLSGDALDARGPGLDLGDVVVQVNRTQPETPIAITWMAMEDLQSGETQIEFIYTLRDESNKWVDPLTPQLQAEFIAGITSDSGYWQQIPASRFNTTRLSDLVVRVRLEPGAATGYPTHSNVPTEIVRFACPENSVQGSIEAPICVSTFRVEDYVRVELWFGGNGPVTDFQHFLGPITVYSNWEQTDVSEVIPTAQIPFSLDAGAGDLQGFDKAAWLGGTVHNWWNGVEFSYVYRGLPASLVRHEFFLYADADPCFFGQFWPDRYPSGFLELAQRSAPDRSFPCMPFIPDWSLVGPQYNKNLLGMYEEIGLPISYTLQIVTPNPDYEADPGGSRKLILVPAGGRFPDP